MRFHIAPLYAKYLRQSEYVGLQSPIDWAIASLCTGAVFWVSLHSAQPTSAGSHHFTFLSNRANNKKKRQKGAFFSVEKTQSSASAQLAARPGIIVVDKVAPLRSFAYSVGAPNSYETPIMNFDSLPSSSVLATYVEC